MKVCLSCGMPLDESRAGSDYCQYCTDENGKLKSREEIQAGFAGYLQSWAPVTEGVDFMKRAEHMMKAMPAWADQ